jgi:UDP-N-acetylmuramoylalanine--D-glutamate ligase
VTVDVRGKKVTVVGLGRTALALVRLLLREGAEPFVTEQAATPGVREFAGQLEGLGVRYETGGHTSAAVDGTALIIPSPGVPPRCDVVRRAVDAGAAMMGELEFASRFCTAQVLAVTGTNGKTTTTELLRALVAAAGHEVALAGNNARPLSEAVLADPQPPWMVVEVSSYQLETASTFRPRAGVVLNVTPDHLARHGTLENYAAVKSSLFARMGPGDTAVVNADCPVTALMEPPPGVERRAFRVTGPVENGLWADGSTIREGSAPVASLEDLMLPGRHNLQNALAALTIARAAELDWPGVLRGLRNFRGVEHRIEFVAEDGGVRYYNDSKATNVDSLRVALESFDARPHIVLIAGGRGKGADYAVLREMVRSRVAALVTLGEDAPLLAAAFGDLTPTERASGMEAAVRAARRLARPGQLVLLSPACASFDMYADFEERGNDFKRCVRALAAAAGEATA